MIYACLRQIHGWLMVSHGSQWFAKWVLTLSHHWQSWFGQFFGFFNLWVDGRYEQHGPYSDVSFVPWYPLGWAPMTQIVSRFPSSLVKRRWYTQKVLESHPVADLAPLVDVPWIAWNALASILKESWFRSISIEGFIFQWSLPFRWQFGSISIHPSMCLSMSR